MKFFIFKNFNQIFFLFILYSIKILLINSFERFNRDIITLNKFRKLLGYYNLKFLVHCNSFFFILKSIKKKKINFFFILFNNLLLNNFINFI
jgi:hypothetical protein